MIAVKPFYHKNVKKFSWHLFMDNLQGEKMVAFERLLWHVANIFGTLLFIFLVTRFFLITPGRVNGQSMEPGFIDEQMFFVNKFILLVRPPERLDVVQIIDPESNKLIIKRVIALPGEEVEIKQGHVYVKKNGESTAKQLDESDYLFKDAYTKVQGQKGVKIYTVKANEYFLLGDNRAHSTDSRVYGPVFRSRIVGEIMKLNFNNWHI